MTQYLIIGQGLAGSLLAWTLRQHNQAVTLLDNVSPHAASRVAAGLLNSIVGQRLVKPDDLDDCWSAAMACYTRLAQHLNREFYFPRRQMRLFRQAADADRYKARYLQPGYQSLLGNRFRSGESGEPILDPLGGFEIYQTGYLNIQALLQSLRQYFLDHAQLIEADLNYDDLIFESDAIQWRQHRFNHIIFCEGASVSRNPWFRWLPFQFSKGEHITLRTTSTVPRSIINTGYWLLPVENGDLKLGASYAWEWEHEKPSTEVEKQLLDIGKSILGDDRELQIVEHKAGIRPTTRDKHPIIGTHPDFSNIHIFNGFGSRGALQIPFYADCFVRRLLTADAAALPKTVDIARFESGDDIVTLARRYLSHQLRPGDKVVDATVGNGHDTAFMAHCVGERGHVYGFDIQSQAITETCARLTRQNVADRVSLIQASHVNMLAHVPVRYHHHIKAVVFNLGYLPGKQKHIVTRRESTLVALQQSLQMLAPNGMISVVCYPGHSEGLPESQAVAQWVSGLDSLRYHTRWFARSDRKASPTLAIICKKRATT